MPRQPQAPTRAEQEHAYAGTTVTSDLHDLMPDDDPAAVAAQLDAQAKATEFEQNLYAQQAIEAERAGVPPEIWATLAPEVRERIMVTGIRRQPVEPVDLAESTLQAAVDGDHTEMDTLVRELLPPEERTAYVLMCDPPRRYRIDGTVAIYHPGTSKISRKAIAKKIKGGFSIEPRYPFLPAAAVPCEMSDSAVFGLEGEPCEYRGRSLAEVNMHMALAHKREMAMLTEHRQRERDMEQIAAQRETAEAARASAEAARLQVELMRRTLEATENLPRPAGGKVA